MSEKRKTPRKIAQEVLEVMDRYTNTKLGSLVNISAEGLMIISSEPFSAGAIYQLDLMLPNPIKNRRKISFGAEVVWSAKATQPGSHWSGFRIIDASEDDVLCIDELIIDWHTA